LVGRSSSGIDYSNTTSLCFTLEVKNKDLEIICQNLDPECMLLHNCMSMFISARFTSNKSFFWRFSVEYSSSKLWYSKINLGFAAPCHKWTSIRYKNKRSQKVFITAGCSGQKVGKMCNFCHIMIWKLNENIKISCSKRGALNRAISSSLRLGVVVNKLLT